MTLRQFFRELVVARRRDEAEHNRDMTLAWHTAALVRTKKMPALPELLIRPVMVKQSVKEQRMVVDTIAAHLGKELRRVRLIRVGEHG